MKQDVLAREQLDDGDGEREGALCAERGVQFVGHSWRWRYSGGGEEIQWFYGLRERWIVATTRNLQNRARMHDASPAVVESGRADPRCECEACGPFPLTELGSVKTHSTSLSSGLAAGAAVGSGPWAIKPGVSPSS